MGVRRTRTQYRRNFNRNLITDLRAQKPFQVSFKHFCSHRESYAINVLPSILAEWNIVESSGDKSNRKTIESNTQKRMKLLISLNSFALRKATHNEGFVRSAITPPTQPTYVSILATPFSQFVSMRNKNLILPFYRVLIDFLLCVRRRKMRFQLFHSRFSSQSLCCIYFRLRVNHDVAIDWVRRWWGRKRADCGSSTSTDGLRKGWDLVLCWAQHVILLGSASARCVWDIAGDEAAITAMEWLIQWP